MSFLSRPQLEELSQFALWADHEARADLSTGFIQTENEYTHVFVHSLRRIINGNSQTKLKATSFTLSQSVERVVGADAAIVLTKGRRSKLAVLEAKWPRFSEPDYSWDYAQGAAPSHFSSQLDRQARYSDVVAVFGMFYNEFPFGPVPPFMDRNNSSCVWHEDLVAFRDSRGNSDLPWTQKELSEVIASHPLNIGQVMTAFGECAKGKPIPMVNPVAIASEFRVPSFVLSVAAGNLDKHDLEPDK